jgi:hypothetical protein
VSDNEYTHKNISTILSIVLVINFLLGRFKIIF